MPRDYKARADWRGPRRSRPGFGEDSPETLDAIMEASRG